MSPGYEYVKDGSLLKVAGLSVLYNVPILRDVTFTIEDIKRPGKTQGQKEAILGPSGMGKTQLFNCLSGLQAPSAGSILIGTEQAPVTAGMVGVVPQNYLLFEHRTVGSSLMLAASMREKDKQKAKEKVLFFLSQLGLVDKWKMYPQELSGGQRQRISIIEQMLSSNHFLLFDEPFSGLDILMKAEVYHLMDQIAASDELNTMIFTTHDIESAVMVADTIHLLGRDRDSSGSIVPGARIQRTIDLIERDLAWHPDIEHQANFQETVNEIKAAFRAL